MKSFIQIQILLPLVVVISAFAAQAQVDNLALQSSFVYNFTKFITWQNPLEGKENFTIAVYSDNGWFEVLKKEIHGRKVGAAAIEVVAIKKPEFKIAPRILIIDHPFAEDMDALIALANKEQALVISRFDGMIAKGVCINFYVDDHKVRFEINKTCVENTNFKLSSQLLKLAKIK